MKSQKTKTPSGRSRSRRPRTGNYKSILVALSDEERALIEAAAAKEDVSVSQFMAKRSAQAAKRLLAKPSIPPEK